MPHEGPKSFSHITLLYDGQREALFSVARMEFKSVYLFIYLFITRPYPGQAQKGRKVQQTTVDGWTRIWTDSYEFVKYSAQLLKLWAPLCPSLRSWCRATAFEEYIETKGDGCDELGHVHERADIWRTMQALLREVPGHLRPSSSGNHTVFLKGDSRNGARGVGGK